MPLSASMLEGLLDHRHDSPRAGRASRSAGRSAPCGARTGSARATAWSWPRSRTCRWPRAAGVVRSNSSGLAWVVGLLSSVTVAALPRTASAMACASRWVQTRSAFFSASSASFFHCGIEPLAGVLAGLGREGGVDFPVVAADELADLLLALHHHRQRRRLHPAHGGQEEAAVARVEGRHGARAVDADQPVGLGAAARGVGQPLHLLVGAQAARSRRGWPAASCDCSHRRLTGLPSGLAPPAYCSIRRKISSPSRPASQALTSCAHVLALGQLDHRVQARLGLVHRLQVEVRRNHRQVGKAPLAALDVEFLRAPGSPPGGRRRW